MTHDSAERAVKASFETWTKVLHVILEQLEGAYIDLGKFTVEDPHGIGTLLIESDFPEGYFLWLEQSGLIIDCNTRGVAV